MPPGGSFIHPFGGLGLSPHRGALIPPRGWFYPPIGSFAGGYCPFGVVLSLLVGDFIPPSGRGGGVVTLSGAEGYGPSLC